MADDFVYALKRHATTRIEAPVYAVFAEYVIGLKDYGELIKREDAKLLAGLPETCRTNRSSISGAGRWRARRRSTATRCASA